MANIIMRNVTGGISPTEMWVYTGGRQTGKSWWAHKTSMQINNTKYMKIASALVDDEPWHTVLVAETTAQWLRTQDKSLVTELHDTSAMLGSTFDVHEKIYLLIVLKFQ